MLRSAAMFDSVWQLLGTLSTVAFVVSAIIWAHRRPEAKVLPLWAWPLLVIGSVLLTIGNQGYVRSLFLLVTGGVLVVAVLQTRGRMWDMLRPPSPPAIPESAPPARPVVSDEMMNWESGHDSAQKGLIRLWVRSLDVSQLQVVCEVQDPDGEVHREYSPDRPQARGRAECVYPTDFVSYDVEPPPLKDGLYRVQWLTVSVMRSPVRRDNFQIAGGDLVRE
jgi:hypothetical protein